jgi:uncharacterized SAM-binding protein YcdF (DUF218 family)
VIFLKSKKETVVKYLSIALGAVFVVLGILYNLKSNFTVGTVFSYLLGLILLAYGIFHKTLSRKIPNWIKYIAVFGYIFVLTFTASLYICGNNDNVDYKEDAIIVLGAGIKGEKIGTNLQKRLDTVIGYHHKNPDAVIVVSGGQGPYEDISEALAMERYLVANGIPQDKIIKEDRSTSTQENFEFSKKLLDLRFGEENYKAAYVTNGYHVYRAGVVAENAGLDGITHIHAETPWYTAVPNGLREVLAVMKTWLVG